MKTVTIGIFSFLLTCFLTFPCFADELSTKSQSIESVKYNAKDVTMATEIGMMCTTDALFKALINKNKDEYDIEKIRKCIKDKFTEIGWYYDRD